MYTLRNVKLNNTQSPSIFLYIIVVSKHIIIILHSLVSYLKLSKKDGNTKTSVYSLRKKTIVNVSFEPFEKCALTNPNYIHNYSASFVKVKSFTSIRKNVYTKDNTLIRDVPTFITNDR